MTGLNRGSLFPQGRRKLWLLTSAPVAMAFALVGAGCTVGPDYRRPTAPTPAAYKELGWQRARPADAIDWLLVEDVVNLVWEARVVGGTPRAADDVSELGWFARDEVPPLREIAMAEPVERWLAESS